MLTNQMPTTSSHQSRQPTFWNAPGRWSLSWLALMLALLLGGSADAENLVSLIHKELRSKPTASQERPTLKELQQRLKAIAKKIDKGIYRERLALLDKQLAQARSQQKALRTSPTDKGSKQRAQLAHQVEEHIAAIRQVKRALTAQGQTYIKLQNALKDCIETRQTIGKQIETNFTKDRFARLKALIEQFEKRQAQRQKALARSQTHLKQLHERKTAQDEAEEQARQAIFALKPPTRRPPPARAKTPPKPRSRRRRKRRKRSAKTRKQRKKQEQPKQPEQHQTPAQLRRQRRLARLKHQIILLEGSRLLARIQEEERHQETLRIELHTYAFALQRLKKRRQRLASQVQGGLLYREPFAFRAAVWTHIAAHTGQLPSVVPARVQRLGQILADVTATSWRSRGVALSFLIVGLILLFGVVLWLRRQLSHLAGLLFKRRRSEWGSFWRLLHTLTLTLRHTTLWLYAYGCVRLLLWTMGFPDGWQSLCDQLAWIVLITVSLHRLICHAFSAQREERMFLDLKDDVARRFRIVAHVLTGLSLCLLPLSLVTQSVGYQDGVSTMLQALFFALLVAGLVWLFLDRRALIPLLSFGRAQQIQQLEEAEEQLQRQKAGTDVPEDTSLRWQRLLLRALLPTIFAIGLGLVLLYLVGYHNLSIYIAKGLLLTAIIVSVGIGAFRGGLYLSGWLFGLPHRLDSPLRAVDYGLRTLLSRGAELVLGVALVLLCLGLLLEIWQVPTGYKLIFTLLTSPLFTVQKTSISTWSIVKFILVFACTIWLAGVLEKLTSRFVFPHFQWERGLQFVISTVMRYAVIALGILLGLGIIGVDLRVLAALAGVVGIGVGFGMRDIANNFISGLLLLFSRPISIGDLIEVGDIKGTVISISIRTTTIHTIDHRKVLIPNSQIVSERLVNLTSGPPYMTVNLTVGVACDSDAEQVKELLLEIAKEHELSLSHPAPSVAFVNFGDSTLDFKLYVAVADPSTAFGVLSDLRFTIKRRMEEAGIEMPFPQRDLHLAPEIKGALQRLSSAQRPRETETPQTPLPAAHR